MQFQNLVPFEKRDTQISFFLSPQNETLKLFSFGKKYAVRNMRYAVCSMHLRVAVNDVIKMYMVLF